MLLKHLINPGPKILLFFIVFSIVFVCLPLLQFPLHKVFSNNLVPPFVMLLSAIIFPSFHALGLNNLIYEKNIILSVSLSNKLSELSSSDKHADPFKRTVSRLFEMTILENI